MRIGTIVLTGAVLQTAPIEAKEIEPINISGFLGFDFSVEHALRLDYRRKSLDIFVNDQWRDAISSTQVRLKVALETEEPIFTAEINHSFALNHLEVDTAGSLSLFLFNTLSVSNQRWFSAVNDTREAPIKLHGVGGDFEAIKFRLNDLSIGDADEGAIDSYRALPTAVYSSTDDGILGPDFLSKFTTYIDYPHSEVPN